MGLVFPFQGLATLMVQNTLAPELPKKSASEYPSFCEVVHCTGLDDWVEEGTDCVPALDWWHSGREKSETEMR